MVRRNALAAAVAACLVCAVCSPAAAQENPAKVREALAAARSDLDDSLVDYTSARFKTVRLGLTEIGDAPYLCGLVNAKNQAGAYTGWRIFAWTSWSRPELEIQDDPEVVPTGIANRCKPASGFEPGDFSALLTYTPPH